MAKTISDIRAQYPQYNDLSDRELAEGLHQKHYSDMPFEDFAERVGLSAPEGDVEVGQPTIVDRAASALMRDDAPRRGDGSRYGAGPGIDWQGRPGGESARRQTERIRAERQAAPAVPEQDGGLGLRGLEQAAPSRTEVPGKTATDDEDGPGAGRVVDAPEGGDLRGRLVEVVAPAHIWSVAPLQGARGLAHADRHARRDVVERRPVRRYAYG